jgi:hypothetical protein
MSQVNKKGISEMVSYVLLIIMAVGIASFVFIYLKGYLPGNKPECPSIESISVSANEIVCNNSILTIEIENNGLFNVSAAYIRMGKEGRKVKSQINTDNVYIFNRQPLAPGQKYDYRADIGSLFSTDGIYDLDIQPAVNTDKGLAICRISRYKVNCVGNL